MFLQRELHNRYIIGVENKVYTLMQTRVWRARRVPATWRAL